MSLTNALIIATQSLGTISSQINVVSRNISNAGTEGSTKKTPIVTTGYNGGSELKGLKRETNFSVFRTLLSANSNHAKCSRVTNALDQIDLSLNLSDPTNSRAPAALISKLADALHTYSTKPDDRTGGELAIQSARDVLTALHDNSRLISELRRDSDDNIAKNVELTNQLLDKIHLINQDIISSSGSNIDITDLMDQRDTLLKQLSEIIGIKTTTRPNQEIVIYADNHSTLLEKTPRYLSFQKTADLSPGVIGSAVYIDGVQATGATAPSQLMSGMIAGDINVRDDLTQTYQAHLDEIARSLINAFAEYDQSGTDNPPLPGLFTTKTGGSIPNAHLISGLVDQIVINPLADPSQGGNATLLRDGGISGNSQYIYNQNGFAGYADRILELADSLSINQTYDPKAGLESNGSLLNFSESSVGWIGAQKQSAFRVKTYTNSIFTQSSVMLSSTTGVNIDEQMTQMLALENAFQASAKVLQTINSVYDSLFAAINR